MQPEKLDGFLDELTKISAGLAPPGAPSINSKGAMPTPKMPKLNVPKTGGGMPGGSGSALGAGGVGAGPRLGGG